MTIGFLWVGPDHGQERGAIVNDWFLPTDERPWTSGNQVTPHVHGANYFARVLEVVNATEAEDRIFLTDWRGDADQKLTDDGPTVAELLVDAANRGVEVRGLLWRSHSDTLDLNAQENRRLGTIINEAGGETLFDERIRRGGSHHQKLLVVRRKGRPEEDVAFVGGIDLCHGRRDDAEHRGDPQAPPLDDRYGPTPPWHDASLEIRGPAVAHLLDVFSERWDDPTPLDHRNPYRWAIHQKAKMPRHPEKLPERWDPPPEVGPHKVQVLRTYPRKRPAYPFAPEGERSIAHAYERTFAQAKRLVYLEDQYLWSTSATRALAEALRREPGLEVIAVVPRYPEEGGLSGAAMRWGQQRAIDQLTEAGGDRFAVFDLHNAAGTPVYVHAKICIVDDTWMTCGSDNLNIRSWTHDSELSCAVVDPDGKLARDLRTTLWSEHLGLPRNHVKLRTLDNLTALWRDRATDPGSRIRVHDVEPVPAWQRPLAKSFYRAVCDPDGRPRGIRGTDRF